MVLCPGLHLTAFSVKHMCYNLPQNTCISNHTCWLRGLFIPRVSHNSTRHSNYRTCWFKIKCSANKIVRFCPILKRIYSMGTQTGIFSKTWLGLSSTWQISEPDLVNSEPTWWILDKIPIRAGIILIDIHKRTGLLQVRGAAALLSENLMYVCPKIAYILLTK